MDYSSLKHLHLLTVAISVSGFAIRALASFAGARWVRLKPTRILVQTIDSLLLASALGMLWIWSPSLREAHWVVAKLVGLVAYIILGTFALRERLAMSTRIASLIAALLTFSWMASVAFSKNPVGWLDKLLVAG